MKTRPTIEYTKQLDGSSFSLPPHSHFLFSSFLEMKNQYIKLNSTRCSTNETINKTQLASRLKVIEFLKDQLYPTGKDLPLFELTLIRLFRFINNNISNIQ